MDNKKLRQKIDNILFPTVFAGKEAKSKTDQLLALIEEVVREERERIVEWGDRDCPHNTTIRLKVKRE